MATAQSPAEPPALPETPPMTPFRDGEDDRARTSSQSTVIRTKLHSKEDGTPPSHPALTASLSPPSRSTALDSPTHTTAARGFETPSPGTGRRNGFASGTPCPSPRPRRSRRKVSRSEPALPAKKAWVAPTLNGDSPGPVRKEAKRGVSLRVGARTVGGKAPPHRTKAQKAAAKKKLSAQTGPSLAGLVEKEPSPEPEEIQRAHARGSPESRRYHVKIEAQVRLSDPELEKLYSLSHTIAATCNILRKDTADPFSMRVATMDSEDWVCDDYVYVPSGSDFVESGPSSPTPSVPKVQEVEEKKLEDAATSDFCQSEPSQPPPVILTEFNLTSNTKIEFDGSSIFFDVAVVPKTPLHLDGIQIIGYSLVIKQAPVSFEDIHFDKSDGELWVDYAANAEGDKRITVLRDGTKPSNRAIKIRIRRPVAREDIFGKSMTIGLPTVEPSNVRAAQIGEVASPECRIPGRLLSETYHMRKLPEPFHMSFDFLQQFSTWKSWNFTQGLEEYASIERKDLPLTYPQRMDQAILKLTELKSVTFAECAFEDNGDAPQKRCSKLSIAIDEDIKGNMWCALHAIVEAPTHGPPLLKIDPWNWELQTASVDGVDALSSEGHGSRWRKAMDGDIVLCASSSSSSPVERVSVRVIFRLDKEAEVDRMFPLPRIVDMPVMGGGFLTHQLKRCLVKLEENAAGCSGQIIPKSIASQEAQNGEHFRLPDLAVGYDISIEKLPEEVRKHRSGSQPATRQTSGDEEPPVSILKPSGSWSGKGKEKVAREVRFSGEERAEQPSQSVSGSCHPSEPNTKVDPVDKVAWGVPAVYGPNDLVSQEYIRVLEALGAVPNLNEPAVQSAEGADAEDMRADMLKYAKNYRKFCKRLERRMRWWRKTSTQKRGLKDGERPLGAPEDEEEEEEEKGISESGDSDDDSDMDPYEWNECGSKTLLCAPEYIRVREDCKCIVYRAETKKARHAGFVLARQNELVELLSRFADLEDVKRGYTVVTLLLAALLLIVFLRWCKASKAAVTTISELTLIGAANATTVTVTETVFAGAPTPPPAMLPEMVGNVTQMVGSAAQSAGANASETFRTWFGKTLLGVAQ